MSASCGICYEKYKKNDEIYSTSCGHVYHFHCMQQWRARGTSCPECRVDSRQIFKLYLNIDDGETDENSQFTLGAKLEESLKKCSALEVELKASQRSSENMHEEDLKTISELEYQLQHCEQNWLQLQQEFEVTKEELNERINEITILKAQRESRETEITAKDAENAALINDFEKALDSHEDGSGLKVRVKMLEDHLKETSLKLQNEIRVSSQLKFDNTKMQIELEMLKTPSPSVSSAATAIGSGARAGIEATSTARAASQQEIKRNQQETVFAKSVIVGRIPEIVKNLPLKEFVLKLTRLMELKYSDSDIEKVEILVKNANPGNPNNNIDKPKTISLVIQFKALNHKVSFLSGKEKLKNNSQAKDFIITDYVSDGTNRLYHHAKALKSHGYQFVFFRNDAVYVKKNRDDANIKIRNFLHVNELIASARSKSRNANAGARNFDLFDSISVASLDISDIDDIFSCDDTTCVDSVDNTY